MKEGKKKDKLFFICLKLRGRWEGGSCLGMHVHPWWIHVNVWQNQYSIVEKNKVKIKIKKKKKSRDVTLPTEVRLVKAVVFFSSHVWM